MVNSKRLVVGRGIAVVILFGLVSCLSLSWINRAFGQEVVGEKKYSTGVKEEALISINIKDADIKNVLRLIATSANINIIPGPEVQGSVSVRIKDVPWETALATILKTYGFAYVREENIIRVTTVGKLKEEDLQTKTYFLNFATASTIQESVKGILSERGKIKTDERTNALIITDIPSNLTKIEEIMKELDAETVQVMIEARIIETKIEPTDKLGINWDIVGTAAGARRALTFPFETKEESKWLPGEIPAPSGTAADTTAAGEFRFGYLDATGLKAVLQLLNSKTDTRILSHPRITTLNNQKAMINVGDKYPIPQYTYNAEVGYWEITDFEYKDLGIKLTVTPNVNKQGYVSLKIHPEINEWSITDVVTFALGGQGSVDIPRYSTREAETQVMVKDGDTLVIGGLLKEKRGETSKKIPLLGDIPFLGYFFGGKTVTGITLDLLIFVTPHVVKVGEMAEGDRLRLIKSEFPERRRMEEVKKEVIKGIYQAGKSYCRERKYEEAIEQFNRVLELEPTHRGARKYLQRAERRLERRK
ncbi:secretin and TonB N-terminal domain-containing protein [bacterium]|nr:secretin and TonB N-terminal domain-containing protein [bacterium]MCK4325723.1 secretin and TonB N-terminal domain-containing protein [bacterium]